MILKSCNEVAGEADVDEMEDEQHGEVL